MSYSNGLLSSPTTSSTHGPPGPPGIGFKLTDDGNYDIDGKRLTNVADSTDDHDAVNLKVLKEHTQVSQNNYHLQPSFKIYKEFGDKSQLTVGKPPNTSSNHSFNNHKAHHDPYIVDKEADDTGFSGEAWSSMIMKGNQLERGTYTSIFEIFVIGDPGGFRVDDTIIYQVWGNSHYTITTFDSDKINGQYTRSIIQFTTDGGAGADDGIKFQIKYFGSQYNKNIKFLFYSRVIKGIQSTSFDHTIFNVIDVKDNHTILYFENLNLNGNLIDGLSDPVTYSNAANKNYVHIKNAQQDIAIADKASKSYVDNQIANVQIDTTPLLPRDGSRNMTGDLDMDEHHILSVKTLTDHKVDDAYSDIVKDLKSVVNKEYLNQNFLKIKGNDYDLNQRVIKNSATHDDGSYDNNTLVSKAFVDAEIAKLPKPDTDVLKLDRSKAMTGNLDMDNNEIKNLKDPVNDHDAVTKNYVKNYVRVIEGSLLPKNGSEAMRGNLDMNNDGIKNLKDPVNNQDAGTKKWINTQLNTKADLTYTNTQLAKKLDLSGGNMAGDINLVNSHKIINSPNPSSDTDLVTKKYMETHVSKSHVTSSNRSNAFKYVMDTPANHLTDEDVVEFGNLVTLKSSPHTINKNVVDTKLLFDAGDGYYSSIIGINLYVLPSGSYTLAFELIWSGDDVDRDSLSLNGISAVETIHNVSNKVFDNYSRLIVQFSKYQNIDPNHLYVDITIKMKTGRLYPPKLQTYMVCYGIKGLQTDVASSVYDAIWGIDNGKITFNEMIDMNNKDIIGVNKITTTNLDVNGQIDMKNKDIIGVNKITTADLDVNSQIDMKGNKIKGVGDGTSNNDAVNKIQLDILDAKININKTNIQNINNHNGYFAYTNQLKHNNENTVKFPPINRSLKHWRPSISYPFELVPNDNTKLKIKLDGWYQINYTDNIRYGGQFKIYDDTNGVYPFVINLPYYNFFTQFTINAIFEIIIDKNLVNYVEIKLMCDKPILNKNRPELDGVGASSFFIKYLGP